jgi:hypothetical protein
MAPITGLDHAMLVSFDAPGVFMSIDQELERGLIQLPETKERIEGCLQFAWHVAYEPAKAGAPDEDAQNRRKYLRALLAEYVSIEESAKIDYRSLGLNPPSGIQALPDPRLHAVRLFRHANIHLYSSKISRDSRPAVWNSSDGLQHFDFTLFIADNLESSIRATGAANRYLEADLAPMITWLEAEQREWGIQNVILRAAEAYTRVLLRGIGRG